MPSNPYDAKGLLKTALTGDDPVLYLEHKLLLNRRGPVPEAEFNVPFGQAAVVREGSDATVVALAVMVPKALEVCDELAKDGLDIEVIDPRTLAPLDMATILESVHKTGRLLIADETFGPCGLGAEISAQVMENGFDDLDAPIARLNGVHTPTPYSPTLENAIIPDKAAITKAIRELAAE